MISLPVICPQVTTRVSNATALRNHARLWLWTKAVYIGPYRSFRAGLVGRPPGVGEQPACSSTTLVGQRPGNGGPAAPLWRRRSDRTSTAPLAVRSAARRPG